MLLQPPRSTRTDTHIPYTTHFRARRFNCEPTFQIVIPAKAGTTIKSNSNSNSNSTPPGSPITPAPTSFAKEPAHHAPRPLRHLLHHPVRRRLRAAGLAGRVDRAAQPARPGAVGAGRRAARCAAARAGAVDDRPADFARPPRQAAACVARVLAVAHLVAVARRRAVDRDPAAGAHGWPAVGAGGAGSGASRRRQEGVSR